MSEPLEKLDVTDELIAERRKAYTGKLQEDIPVWMAKTITYIDGGRFLLIQKALGKKQKPIGQRLFR